MRASARARTRGAAPKRTSSMAKPALLGAALLAAVAVALFVWGMLPDDDATASATVSTYEPIDMESIQAELDRQVRESMMTVAVSPVCELSDDGTLSLRVLNDESNKLAQSFTLQQEGAVLFRSEPMKPGEEITSCKPDGIRTGDALITVQGIDPASNEPSGSPAAVEVSIIPELEDAGASADV